MAVRLSNLHAGRNLPQKSSCTDFCYRLSFGGKYCVHLQDRRISKTINKQQEVIRSAVCLLPAGCFYAFVFDSEDGGNTFPRNVDKLLKY
jgi:hypothetical protein